MHRVAVFVDAGYVFAQGSVLLCGTKLARGQVVLQAEEAVAALTEFARAVSGAELLRIYWYDGTSIGPTPQHLTMAHLPNVKLRLGFVNSVGEQKGVDSLIITDMIALARNRAIGDAVLVSGDEDIRVGVQQAQEFGVRVHLLGIKPSRGSQSLFLLQESDTTHEWDSPDVSRFLQVREATVRTEVNVTPSTEVGRTTSVAEALGADIPSAGTVPSQAPVDALDASADEVALRLDLSDLSAVIEAFDTTRQVPVHVDRQLLGTSRSRLGRVLESDEKRLLRQRFIDRCRRRLDD
jgi:NYN domain